MIEFEDTRYKSSAWDMGLFFFWDRIPLGVTHMVEESWVPTRGSWG